MRQDEHRHDDVFGYCRLVSEDVADRDPLRQRAGIDQVKSCRGRLEQAEPWRRREAGAPDMTNYDLGVGQQPTKLPYIAFILEYLCLQGRFHLGKNARGNGCGEMAEKQSFHMGFFQFCIPQAMLRSSQLL